MSGENQTDLYLLAAIDVGAVLRAMRMAACLTQRQLAGQMLVSAHWVRVRERNQVGVGLIEFIRWSKACGQDPGEAVEHLWGPSLPFRQPTDTTNVLSLNHMQQDQLRADKTALR